MNKIIKLLDDLSGEAYDEYGDDYGLPLVNLSYLKFAENTIKEFCWKLALEASELERDEDFQEWFDNYLTPKPEPTAEKVKVLIATLKQFNWNSVYNLVGIDYNVFDDIHIVELDKEIFQKLFK